jgi:hypothetical protein
MTLPETGQGVMTRGTADPSQRTCGPTGTQPRWLPRGGLGHATMRCAHVARACISHASAAEGLQSTTVFTWASVARAV